MNHTSSPVRLLIGLACLLVLLAGCAASPPVPEGEPSSGPARFDPGFTHGAVPVDGGALHYVRGGSGPPLVLLHGWPQTWWAWHDVMPRLARHRTVIAFDLPGLGDSAIPPGGFDAATTAARIHEGVRTLGFDRVELLAHDVGGLVAHPYARDFPAAVSRLMVIEAPLPGFGLDEYRGFLWHLGFNASPAPLPERMVDDEDVPTYLGAFFEGVAPERLERDVYFRAYGDPARRSAGYEYYRALDLTANDNRARVASRLAVPVVAMGGQNSFADQVAASWRQVATDTRTAVVPGVGHFVPEEDPDAVVACAEAFFAMVPSGRPALAGCGV